MNSETQKIFEEQLVKLPAEVVDFISSTNWDEDLNEIGTLYNLGENDLHNFKRETTLVLTGLVNPDLYAEDLEKEVGLHGSILDAIVAAVEKRIFAPIRPSLISFFQKEAVEHAEVSEGAPREPAPRITELDIAPVQKPRPTITDAAPDNLPVADEPEPLFPPIPPKRLGEDSGPINWDITPTYAFEEKMKKVFTAGKQSMNDLTLEPALPQTPPPQVFASEKPKSPPDFHADPYREAIE